MDGPQNVLQGFAGFEAIPFKDQREDQVWPEWPAPPEECPPGSEAEELCKWEAYMNAIFALMIFASSRTTKPLTLDMERWYRETMHPRDYMNMPYYELWLLAICTYLDQWPDADRVSGQDLLDCGIVSAEQLEHALKIQEVAKHQAVPGFMPPNEEGEFASSRFAEGKAHSPRYRVGQPVRGVLQASAGHTRQYAYLRGREGVIDKVYPATPPRPPSPTAPSTGNGTYEAAYADIASRGRGQEYFIPLYSVCYDAADLFGEHFAEPGTKIYADQWETYLEPLPDRPIRVAGSRNLRGVVR